MTAAEKLVQRERDKALVQGRSEGRPDGCRETLQTLLDQRFGALAAALDQLVRVASEDQLKVWASRVLDATSLDEVFQA